MPPVDCSALGVEDLRIDDQNGNGRYERHEQLLVSATLVNYSSQSFDWYPGVVFRSNTDRVVPDDFTSGEDWRYGLFGFGREPVSSVFYVTGAAVDGQQVTFTATAGSIGVLERCLSSSTSASIVVWGDIADGL